MTATRRPRLEDLGVPYTISQPVMIRRRALHQAEPMRMRGQVSLSPRASWWRRVGALILQAIAWAALVLTGVLCLAGLLLVLWGVAQMFAVGIRLLMGVTR